MNTITNNQNITKLYNRNISQVSDTSQKYEVKSQARKQPQVDSIEISHQALNALGNIRQDSLNSNNPLSNLVTSGTITQDQANAIQAAFQAGGKSIQSSGTYTNTAINPLDSLVSNGIITQDQENAVKNTFDTAIKSNRKHHNGNPLNTLVSDGTLTQDQATSIKNTIDEAIESNRNTRNSPDDTIKNSLDSLVSNGTITQNQEDTIRNTFDTVAKSNHKHYNDDSLNALVSDGTITQDQANSLSNSLIRPIGDSIL